MFEEITKKRSLGSRLLPWIVVILTLAGLWFLYEATQPKRPVLRHVAAPAATASPASAPPATK